LVAAKRKKKNLFIHLFIRLPSNLLRKDISSFKMDVSEMNNEVRYMFERACVPFSVYIYFF
jgi:hypothetical protein